MKKHITILVLIILGIASGILTWWYLLPRSTYRQVSYEQLPGWHSTPFKKSFETFLSSCRVFLKQDPDKVVGTDQIQLQAKDWQPACKVAQDLNSKDEQAIKRFFQQWFAPVEFYNGKPVTGLFTGYYMPAVKGSLKKTEEFSVPLYGVPSDLVTIDLGLFIPHLKNERIVGRIAGRKILPYYTREEINRGAIKNKAKVVAWIHSPVDRLFLEIQGSAIIELEDGKQVYIGYDAQNGAPYTAIAGVLIKKGVMTKDTASMQAIKHYLESHPKQIHKIINQNKSFVFFKKMDQNAAFGSQGVQLTDGYSLAIDRQWVPMGAPIWLSTTRPDSNKPTTTKPMNRLMIAQDTGGAIKGKVRGDIYWGGGERATAIAGHMKNPGYYWILLPRHVLSRMDIYM